MERVSLSGNILTRNRGKLALIAALAGAVALAPEAWHGFEDWAFPESKIVAGVPGQVETDPTGSYCTMTIKRTCITSATDYYLGIEQCPADVQAAKQGRQTTSFDPKIGEMYEGCYYDEVQVDATTWQSYPIGTTIMFSGNVGEHLRK